jgi:3-dehydroquinate synthase
MQLPIIYFVKAQKTDVNIQIMDRTFSKLTVEIPADPEHSAHTYPIFTGQDIFSMIGPVASEFHLPDRLIIVTDQIVEKLYATHLHAALLNFGFRPDIITIPPGEANKTLETVRYVYDAMHQAGCGRDTAIMAVGGGIVGDLAGFVAATYRRGIPFVQVPTTLLAQVDSSVGGKVGVNLPYGKNLVGAFYQPHFVFIDTKTLSTLPERELRSGLAEVIKYGAILDHDLFTLLKNTIDHLLKPDITRFTEIIERCCTLKASVVEKDERESGYREILNFGHTIGHAIEACTDYSLLTHGEAITYGMMVETQLSVNHCGLPADQARELCTLLCRLSPPSLPVTMNVDQLYQTMYSDKKVRSGVLRLSLINRIGDATFGETPDEHYIKQSMRKLFSTCEDICVY